MSTGWFRMTIENVRNARIEFRARDDLIGTGILLRYPSWGRDEIPGATKNVSKPCACKASANNSINLLIPDVRSRGYGLTWTIRIGVDATAIHQRPPWALHLAKSATRRSATISHDRFVSAKARARAPMAIRAAGLASSRRIAAAIAPGLSGGTVSPTDASLTDGSRPPRSVATTGTPHARYSRSFSGEATARIPPLFEAIPISAAAIHCGTSSRRTEPTKP